MKKCLLIFIAISISTIAWAGKPVYSSSSPSGLINAIPTYPSPLNSIVTNQQIVITFAGDRIKANGGRTGYPITLNTGTESEITYFSRSGRFFYSSTPPPGGGTGTDTVPSSIIRIGTGSPAEQYKLYIS